MAFFLPMRLWYPSLLCACDNLPFPPMRLWYPILPTYVFVISFPPMRLWNPSYLWACDILPIICMWYPFNLCACGILPSYALMMSLPTSVVDPDPPDPHVFGLPGSGSTSQRYGSGSGSFYQHAKIVRKTLIPTIL